MKKIGIILITFFQLFIFASFAQPVFAEDQYAADCSISLTISATPTELTDWGTTVSVTVEGIRQRPAGYFCGTDDVVTVHVLGALPGKSAAELSSADLLFPSDPTGSGRTTTRTYPVKFQFSNYGATSSTSMVGLSVYGVLKRQTGTNISTSTIQGQSAVTISNTAAGGGSGGTSSNDSYPTKGAVCDNTGTSATIYWYTTAKTIGSLHYAGPTGAGSSQEKALANRHMLKTGALVKGDNYTYNVQSLDKNKALIPNTTTSDIPFVAGAPDENGCADYKAGKIPSGTTGPNSNTNTINQGVPNPKIDTNTSFTLGSLDQNLGCFFNPLGSQDGNCNPTGGTGTLPQIIARLTSILFILTGIIAVIVIIISGFKMVTSNGNPAQLTKARAGITWAVIGLIVSILAFSIVAIIQRVIRS